MAGEKPKHCDICRKDLKQLAFVDGATKFGPWAIMCEACHKQHGCGLGVGKGQRYGVENG